MKTRNGFVSNSSSSSFVLSKATITPLQVALIKDHVNACKYVGMCCDECDKWTISEDDHQLEAYCSMDNFDLKEFADRIGIPSRYIDDSGSRYW